MHLLTEISYKGGKRRPFTSKSFNRGVAGQPDSLKVDQIAIALQNLH